MDKLKQDLKYALRWSIKNFTFTIGAVITLALGIGANTAIFSVVNTLLLQPLPYSQSSRLIRIWPGNLHQKGVFLGLLDMSETLDGIGAYTGNTGVNIIIGGGEPRHVTGSGVSVDLFPVLGIVPKLGRGFEPGEDQPGTDQLVILSHRLWTQQWSGDSGALGSKIVVDGKEREVIGVMPADFRFPTEDTDLWIPVQFNRSNAVSLWAQTSLNMIGRLKNGVSLARADVELKSFVPRLLSMFPWRMPDDWGSDVKIVSLQEDTVGNYRSRLALMFAAVLLVLLIACINVANLFLARSTARRKEMAIRVAIGASRGRIIRQLLTESVLISLIAGAVGVGLALFALPLILSFFPAGTPSLSRVAINWQVMAFATAISVFTGLAFGLFPALRASSTNLVSILKEDGRSAGVAPDRHKLASVLVIGEITVAMVLIISAGLLIKSLWQLSQANPGFHSDQLLTAHVSQLESRCAKPPQCVGFYDDVLTRIRALPGVENAAAVNDLPLGGKSSIIPMAIEGYVLPPGGSPPEGQLFAITAGYMQTMGIRLISGREFTDSDKRDTAGVAIVNESLARTFWPDQNPIGRQIKPFFPKQWWTVVGVVADVDLQGIANEPGPQLYIPYGQFATRGAMNLVVRATGNTSSVARELQSIVSSVDRGVPVNDIRNMNDVIFASMAAPRSTMWLFVAFAAIALVLGAVGLYSLVSYSVTWRTHEIGVRIALGAQPSDITLLVLRQSFLLTFIGIGAGTIASLIVTRILRGLLYHVNPVDPITFLGVALLLATVGFVATYLHCRRAVRVNPIEAMRTQV